MNFMVLTLVIHPTRMWIILTEWHFRCSIKLGQKRVWRQFRLRYSYNEFSLTKHIKNEKNSEWMKKKTEAKVQTEKSQRENIYSGIFITMPKRNHSLLHSRDKKCLKFVLSFFIEWYWDFGVENVSSIPWWHSFFSSWDINYSNHFLSNQKKNIVIEPSTLNSNSFCAKSIELVIQHFFYLG